MKQHLPPSTTGNYFGTTTSMFMPPSIVASADELASKAAELNGLIAPQTANCLAKLVEAADAPLTQAWDASEHNGYDQKNLRPNPANNPRRRILAVFGHYDQLLTSEPVGHGAAWIAPSRTA